LAPPTNPKLPWRQVQTIAADVMWIFGAARQTPGTLPDAHPGSAPETSNQIKGWSLVRKS